MLKICPSPEITESSWGNKREKWTNIFFETCFEKYLLPDVHKDGVVILDNASFHMKKRLFDIAAK